MLNEVLGAAHHHRRKVRVVWVLELFDSVVFLGISQTSRTTQNRSRADLTKSGELQSGEQCLPPGRLIFQHVMKTGGLSLEKFLKCSCSERPNGLCTIRIAANHWGNTAQPKGYGSECPPSICSTHSPPTETDEACGPEFANAKRFTTILLRTIKI